MDAGILRTHVLALLAAGLGCAVALVWALQSGALSTTNAAHSPAITVSGPPANTCDDPTRSETPAKAASLSELQETILPEIHAGIPPQGNRPAVIHLPPDLSAITIIPPVRPQAATSVTPKATPKNKPAPAPVRP